MCKINSEVIIEYEELIYMEILKNRGQVLMSYCFVVRKTSRTQTIRINWSRIFPLFLTLSMNILRLLRVNSQVRFLLPNNITLSLLTKTCLRCHLSFFNQ